MTRAFAWLGAISLIVAIPLAFLGLTTSANRYRAFGVDAIDCDGPISVLIFAVPALAIYAAGAMAYGRPPRRRLRLIAAVTCCLVCLLLTANVVRAVAEHRRNLLHSEACG